MAKIKVQRVYGSASEKAPVDVAGWYAKVILISAVTSIIIRVILGF